MKSSILTTTILFIAISTLVVGSCCKKKCNDPSNPECENYDACFGKYASANFGFREAVWDDIHERYTWRKDYELYTDTVLNEGVLDIEYLGNNIPQNQYKWKIEGMSQVFTIKNIRGISFDNYISNSANWTDLNFNFTKPLNITLTVNTVANNCVPYSDTILSKTKQITFARLPTWEGKFVGSFDVSPEKIDTIYIGSNNNSGYWWYVNFPYMADSTKTWYKIYGSDSASKSYYSMYHNNWTIDQYIDGFGNKDSLIFDRYKGIRQFNFISSYNKELNKYPVKFTYHFEEFEGAKIKIISFQGEKIFN